MKKYIVFLVLFLTNFFLISNVKALTGVSVSTTDLENIYTTMENYKNNLLESSYVDKVNDAISSFEITDDDYYIIFTKANNSNRHDDLYCYKWSKTSNARAFVYAERNKAWNSDYSYLSLTVSKMEENTEDVKLYDYYYINNSLSITSTSQTKKLYVGSISLFQGKVSSSLFTPTSDLRYQAKIISTNADIYFTNNQNYFPVNTSDEYNKYTYYDTISVCDSELCYLTNDNSPVINADGSLNIEPPAPEINIETIEKGYTDETKKEKIFEKIKINFSIFNTDKYLYFYSTSPGKNKTWIDITENNFEYTGYSNGTLYIAVIDKAKYVESAENGQELVFDYITTATYIFAGLAELIPDLEFSTDIPDSCYLTIGGNREIICKRLTVKTKNYNDFNKYRFEYSNDKTNFLTLYANEYVNVYNENTAVVFKLYDAKKDEYIKTITYNLTGISKNMASIGPYVNLIGKYIEKEYYYEISAYFYNYDSSLYNYYYSTDRENWKEIDSVSLSIASGSGSSAVYFRKFNIYENCTFYLKIEDKNGNYIRAITFTVELNKHIDKDLPVNKISSFLDTISEEIKTISDLIKYFYNGLNSIIKDFLVAIFTLIIICSIIILARK